MRRYDVRPKHEENLDQRCNTCRLKSRQLDLRVRWIDKISPPLHVLYWPSQIQYKVDDLIDLIDFPGQRYS